MSTAYEKNRNAVISFTIAILILCGEAGIPLHASDRSIRCGENLIHGGGGKDSTGMYEVLKKCGEPEAKQGNTWIYIQGNMRRILTFRADGRLQRIESVRN